MDEEEPVMRDSVRVPKDRVGAVIGKKGRTRKKLERATGTKITVDSESGVVEITGTEDTLPENFYKATLVVKAIGRGFDDRSAMELLADDRYLEVIDLTDLVGRKRSALLRQRARLIGRDGSVRKKLEALTDTKIRIYGKTVSVIGDEEGIDMATHAIQRIAGEGSPINVVIQELESHRKRRKRARLLKDLGFEVQD